MILYSYNINSHIVVLYYTRYTNIYSQSCRVFFSYILSYVSFSFLLKKNEIKFNNHNNYIYSCIMNYLQLLVNVLVI